jgi:hypothetical protein
LLDHTLQVLKGWRSVLSLTFGKSSPTDILAKAQKDLGELESFETAEDTNAMGDALFNLAVALTSLKDWLKKQPSTTFTPEDVEQCWASSVGLSSFRDIANAGKHRIITKYVPTTSDVLTSVALILDTEAKAGHPPLKIVCTDGNRHRAVDLGWTAICECQAFMNQHGVV